MNDKRNYRLCVGGIILLVITTFGLVSGLINNVSTAIWNFQEIGTAAGISSLVSVLATLVQNLPLLILAVMLAAKVRSMALTVVAAIALVLKLILKIFTLPSLFVAYAQVMDQLLVPVVQLVYSVADLAFLLTVVILCAKATGRNPASARKLKALPGILCIVSGLLSVAYNTVSYLGNMLYSFNEAVLIMALTMAITTLFTSAIHVVAWFLIGDWLANPCKKGYMSQQPAQPYYPPQPQYRQPPYNGGWQG